MKMCLLARARTVALLAVAAGALCPPLSWAQSDAPKYEPDLLWPKPLPNEWTIGGLGGVCADAQDHVFILNRQDAPAADLNAARMAPPIIEFNPAGNVVNAWGDSNCLMHASIAVTSTRTTIYGSQLRHPAWCRNIPMTEASYCFRSVRKGS